MTTRGHMVPTTNYNLTQRTTHASKLIDTKNRVNLFSYYGRVAQGTAEQRLAPRRPGCAGLHAPDFDDASISGLNHAAECSLFTLRAVVTFDYARLAYGWWEVTV